MRFLIDQDIYQITIDFLRREGHNIVTAKDLGMQRASDKELLGRAKEEERIFNTRDKDFGSLVFLESITTKGVILLRTTPSTIKSVHNELSRLIRENKEKELKNLFCVVEPDRYRKRRIH